MMQNNTRTNTQSGYDPAMTSQHFRKTGRHWILITALIVVALGVGAVLFGFFSGPDFTAAEQNYLGVVKQWSAPWPSDEALVQQGNEICDKLNVTPGLKAGALVYLLEDLPDYIDQAEYQIGAAIGSLCPDQAWSMA